MSRENVETVRAAFEAWMSGDLDAMLADADPDMEWYVLPDARPRLRGGPDQVDARRDVDA
jgi:ketosteroid isomerase-like protein